MKFIIIFFLLFSILHFHEDIKWESVPYSEYDGCNTCSGSCQQRTLPDGKIQRKNCFISYCTLARCYQDGPITTYENLDDLNKNTRKF